MFFSRPAGVKYVDRGDPANFDFDTGAFTDDNTWRELDLSSIIGVGVKTVHLRVRFASDSSGVSLAFRKKGNTNIKNIFHLYSQYSAVYYNPKELSCAIRMVKLSIVCIQTLLAVLLKS